MPKLLKFVRGVKHIEYRITKKGHQAEEEVDVTCKEAPLKSLDASMQALAPVAVKVFGFPADYADEATVESVAFSYTKKGTASAAIAFNKQLPGGTNYKFTTPFVRFEKAADGEEGRIEVTANHAQRIALVIEEAEKYINGKRQQMLLPLDDPNKPKSEPADGAELPLGDKDGKTTAKS